MEKKTLKTGEKYLKILVSEGGVDKTFVVFPNPESTPDNNKPDYRANSVNHSVAVWENKKQEKKEQPLVPARIIVESVV
jgi:hypothetical protein